MAELSAFEGKLSKYTNVVKGWQNRYFVINIQMGMLEYHIGQAEAINSGGKPRGALSLTGAVVAPSSDDELTFSVNATNGEVYKLRASSTKERQQWISHLRGVVYHFTTQLAQEHPPLQTQRKPRTASFKAQISNNLNKFKDQAIETSPSSTEDCDISSHQINDEKRTCTNQVQQLSTTGNFNSNISKLPVPHESSSVGESVSAPGTIPPFSARSRADSLSSISKLTKTADAGRVLPKSTLPELKNAREMLISADNYHAGLMNSLETLHDQVDVKEANHTTVQDRVPGSNLALDKDVLLLKATSAAMLQSLSASYILLHKHHLRAASALPQNAAISWVEPRTKAITPNFHSDQSPSVLTVASFESPQLADPNEEIKDPIQEQEEDLGPVDEHKNVIMHLLSQLKLGMDLTKVTLPTFILERRSLLEMYADFFGHTELFLAIADKPTPLQRMCCVLKFYLSSFQCGRRSQTAKKPYNPIIGEVFQCSYYVPKENLNQETVSEPPSFATHHRLKFLAEQVSHHPPVSAFFVTCPEKQIQLNSHIWTKSRFMNMTVGVNNIGEGTLSLLGLDEQYVMTYPSAYARSILTVPWSELGGRCSITCQKTGMTASVNFHTKPTYGGQPHRITAEVKSSDGFVFCRADGKWNGSVELSYYSETYVYGFGDLAFKNVCETHPKFCKLFYRSQRALWLQAQANYRRSIPNRDSVKTESESKELKPQIENLNFSSLKTYPKYVKPIEKQSQMESRKLWLHVTQSLRKGDILSATQHKTSLENQQREVESKRGENKLPLENAFFTRTNGNDFDRYIVNSNVK